MIQGLAPSGKPKSFWEKPEGTTGMIIGIPLAGGVLWGLYNLLPFIITLLQNAITATIFGAVLFVLVWVLSQKRFWVLLWYIYKSLMRMATRIFVEIDPIGILKSYVDDLKKQAGNMSAQISNLRGQMEVLQDTINQNKGKSESAMKMAREAQKNQKNNILVLQSRKAGRLEKSNLTLQNLFTKMEFLYRVLVKYREVCAFFIEDLQSEVEVKEQERKAITASYSAFKSAYRIIQGDPDKREVFDEAMSHLTEDYAMKIGEIGDFISMSSSVVESFDLENGIYEEDALKKLEDWQKRSDLLLLPPAEKDLITEQSADPHLDVLKRPIPEPVSIVRKKTGKKNTDYGKYFKD